MINKVLSISERREQERKRKIHFLTILAIVFIVVLTIFSSTMILADTKSDSAENYKYFKSIEIEEGDTLWSIASEYISYDYYSSVNDYIYEIKKMNGISGNTIQSGQYLIVAYYSDEYK